MPYAEFHAAAEACRRDVMAIGRRFDVSFEQACHRLTTLRRPGAGGRAAAFPAHRYRRQHLQALQRLRPHAAALRRRLSALGRPPRLRHPRSRRHPGRRAARRRALPVRGPGRRRGGGRERPRGDDRRRDRRTPAGLPTPTGSTSTRPGARAGGGDLPLVRSRGLRRARLRAGPGAAAGGAGAPGARR